jgi:tetratricopeptide (TPR) repeat protein
MNVLNMDANGNLSPPSKDKIIRNLFGEEETKKSPTRVTDFDDDDIVEVTEEDDAIIEKIFIHPEEGRSSASSARQLSLAPPDIAKTPPSRRRRACDAKQTLPTLHETVGSVSFTTDELPAQYSPTSLTTPSGTKIKKKSRSGQPKPSRSEKVQELHEKASHLVETGDEEKALKLFKKALQMAEDEVSNIKSHIKISEEKHPVTRKSIQTRLFEDLLSIIIVIGKMRTVLSILHERAGDYKTAISNCKGALNLYQKHVAILEETDTSNELEKQIEETDAMLGRLNQAKSSYEERKKMIDAVVSIREVIATTEDPKQRQDLYKKAEALAQQVKSVETGVLGKAHPQLADTMQLLAALSLEQGRREQAIKYLKKSLQINRSTLGLKHPRTGQSFLRLARLYQQSPAMNRENEDQALSFFTQAVTVFKESRNCPGMVGSILNDISVIHVTRREFERALELLKEALERYRSEAAESSDEPPNIDMVQIYRNMGECNMNLKEFQKAQEDFVTALDIQREVRKIHDTAVEVGVEFVTEGRPLIQMITDESIADTLRRLGRALLASGKHKEALVMYNEALVIHRSAVQIAEKLSTGPSRALIPPKQDQLAHTLYCIAEVYDAAGEGKRALKAYKESMQLRVASDSQRPVERRINRVHCAMCLVGIANFYLKKEEYTEARKLYNTALAHCETQGKNDHLSMHFWLISVLTSSVSVMHDRSTIRPFDYKDD